MLPLDTLQQQFMSALQHGSPITLGPSRIAPEQGLAIYRRNYLENHLTALTDTYASVLALTGDAYFRQLGRRYLAAFPSKSGDLNDYGEHFADFLAQLLPNAPGGDRLPYLPDLARLDWACFHTLRAPNGGENTLSALARWPVERQGLARIKLHPACTLLSSAYPLHAIWQLAQGKDMTVDLDHGGETVLISRPYGVITVSLLDTTDALLLNQWLQGHTLAETLQDVVAQLPETDVPAIFSRINSLAIVGELWSAS